MSVTLSKIQAFCKEFPWLTPYIEELGRYLQFTEVLRVQRLDLEVLGQVPCDDTFTDFFTLRFMIFDESGKLLHEVKQSHKARIRPFHLFRPSTWFIEEIQGQTLEEALFACPHFKYVLRLGQRSIYPHIEIYKLPNAWDLPTWIQKLQHREDVVMQAEVASSDWDESTIDIVTEVTDGAVTYTASLPGTEESASGVSAEEALGKLVRANAYLMGLEINTK